MNETFIIYFFLHKSERILYIYIYNYTLLVKPTLRKIFDLSHGAKTTHLTH